MDLGEQVEKLRAMILNTQALTLQADRESFETRRTELARAVLQFLQ